ncbi:PTS glucose transporter subunit IIA [Faecalicoccus pleomorphus]|uniref:PTS glucose transporter subunit IIA n=1 Tax=Faecalicoccus pleomorphus TaxID=1323 RepID=UPI0022E48EE1|nr:PTS glucose transporter subunit IIA [Faecalicoccus pleomorphus]
MGLFRKKEVKIECPTNGNIVFLKDIPDDAISKEMLGTGVGIESIDGEICSPVDGEVSFVFPTKHAVGLKTKEGLEVLIHLGIDTVELEGKGFDIKCKKDQHVHSGELLAEMDLDFIRKTHNPICILLFPQKQLLTLNIDESQKECHVHEVLGNVKL